MVLVPEDDSYEYCNGRREYAVANEINAVYANHICISLLEFAFRVGTVLDSE